MPSPVLPLSHEETISQVYTSGSRLFFSDFDLRFLPSSSQSPTRLAIVTSKKIFRLAVTRNRVKRRVRASLAPLLPHLILGCSIIITAKTSITKIPFVALKANLATALKRAKLVENHLSAT